MAGRTSLITGPAVITHRGLTHYSDGSANITATLETADAQIMTDGLGPLDVRPTDAIMRVTLTPDGRLASAADANGLFYTLGLAHGASIFTGTDLPLVVKPFDANQKKLTLMAAGITRPPVITLRPGARMFGAMEWAGVRTAAGAWGGANTLVQWATNTGGVASHSFDASNVVTQPWTLTWDPDGAPIVEDIDTVDGWTITPEVTLERKTTASNGTVDYTISNVRVTVTGAAILTQAQLEALTAESTASVLTAVRGASRTAYPLRLSCLDGVNQIDLPLAVPTVGAQLGWGTKANHRVQQVTFESLRGFSAGAPLPLLAFSEV